MSHEDKKTADEPQPAVGGSGVERGVGRPVPERAEDHVLLGLAGAVAECGVRWEVDYGCYSVPSANGPRRWNPLADDGDALRLAVALNLRVVFHPVLNQALVREYHATDREWQENGEDHADPCAAVRRAIVRAAAALGANKTPNVGAKRAAEGGPLERPVRL